MTLIELINTDKSIQPRICAKIANQFIAKIAMIVEIANIENQGNSKII